jgi:SAM-dependent methyltransferase
VSPRASCALIESLPCSEGVKRQVLEGNARRLVAEVQAERERARRAGELPRCPIPETPQEMEELGFEVIAPERFPPDEEARAKQFWASYPVKSWYQKYQPWVDVLCEYVRALKPRKVMEFGCNVGRNLHHSREAFPGLEVYGVDINAAAVAAGRQEFELNLDVANEEIFDHLPPDSFDLIYTVSVLDHMPAVERVCRGMLRCSRGAVLCLEVALPLSGKVVRHFDHGRQEVLDSTGYSYSWDYEAIFRSLGAAWVEVRSTYLHPASLGPYYKAFLAYRHS